jgi:hypothetical protein
MMRTNQKKEKLQLLWLLSWITEYWTSDYLLIRLFSELKLLFVGIIEVTWIVRDLLKFRPLNYSGVLLREAVKCLRLITSVKRLVWLRVLNCSSR